MTRKVIVANYHLYLNTQKDRQKLYNAAKHWRDELCKEIAQQCQDFEGTEFELYQIAQDCGLLRMVCKTLWHALSGPERGLVDFWKGADHFRSTLNEVMTDLRLHGEILGEITVTFKSMELSIYPLRGCGRCVFEFEGSELR